MLYAHAKGDMTTTSTFLPAYPATFLIEESEETVV